jgi:thiamine kinase-like enzyme
VNQERGLGASNYTIIADLNLYFLKIYKGKGEESIKLIEEITQFLYENSIPVILPLITDENLYHCQLNGNLGVIYPKIAHSIFSEERLNDNVLSSLATVMASFHNLKVKCKFKLSTSKKLILPIHKILKELQSLKTILEVDQPGSILDELTIRLINDKIDLLNMVYRFLEWRPACHLVHGDLHSNNILFDGNMDIKAIIDFETTHFGHGIEDIIHFINFTFSNDWHKRKLEEVKTLLCSYSNINLLSKKDIAYGVYHYIYKIASSSFLVKKVIQERSSSLIEHINWMASKIRFYKENSAQEIIDILASCL